ncbi:chemotaxis protein CheW [Geminicoccus flavidas]|uniref:chemotaxis protein CheW n=1 Tax=Geminicoccus flavidas TaxID=2506407 RepID=UPI001359F82B|nr:chemotaxis protein CheW [Geminicoccus flavidas]
MTKRHPEPEPMAAAAAPDGPDGRTRRILLERTRQLAKRSKAAETVTTALLLLEADGESCALRIDAVAEVASMPLPARLPRAGPALLGLVETRGVLCRVYDLAELFGRRAGSARRGGGHLVVLRQGGGRVGLRVDRAVGIVEAPAADLLPADDGLPGTLGRITRSGIDLLDPETILGRVDGTANHVA